MSFVRGLRCRECGREYPQEPIHVCEYCFGPVEVVYDYDAIKASVTPEAIKAGPPTMWRYRALLPIDGDDIVDIGAGYTPLLRADNLGKQLGLKNLYVKNDCVNPSYSFKDRVVSVATSKAREFGFDTMACASTGNLACAVAAHAARASMRAFVFIPADLERGKILGAAIYEPNLVMVDGNYDDVNRMCSELADKYGWAFVNINVRPYYSEGSKTLAFEIAEQLGWRAPDRVVVPIASGSLFTKVWKGFHELHKVGLIGPVHTRMVGAQADGCSPVTTAFRDGTFNVRPVRPSTVAKSLSIGNPADGYYVLKIIEECGGVVESVGDDEIVEGMQLLARTEGIFAETAGGVTVANLKKLARSGAFDPEETIVAIITGNGLKTQEAVYDRMIEPMRVGASLSAFESAYETRQNRGNGSVSVAVARDVVWQSSASS